MSSNSYISDWVWSEEHRDYYRYERSGERYLPVWGRSTIIPCTPMRSVVGGESSSDSRSIANHPAASCSKQNSLPMSFERTTSTSNYELSPTVSNSSQASYPCPDYQPPQASYPHPDYQSPQAGDPYPHYQSPQVSYPYPSYQSPQAQSQCNYASNQSFQMGTRGLQDGLKDGRKKNNDNDQNDGNKAGAHNYRLSLDHHDHYMR